MELWADISFKAALQRQGSADRNALRDVPSIVSKTHFLCSAMSAFSTMGKAGSGKETLSP